MRKFPKTDIYAITDSGLSLGRPLEVVVGALLDAGVTMIQYREKKKKAGEMLRECELIRKMTRDAGAFFIVNDHVDIAVLVGADGVHVGQEDLPVPAVRKLVGEDCVIGLSTHAPDQVLAAVRDGADYIGVGPLFATQTKEDVSAPVGLEFLEQVVVMQALPFAAIGGIKRHNVGDLVRRGCSCCCMVSELVGAPDIAARVAEIRKIMKEHGA